MAVRVLVGLRFEVDATVTERPERCHLHLLQIAHQLGDLPLLLVTLHTQVLDDLGEVLALAGELGILSQ